MISFLSAKAIAIGEAMIEMAPVGDGLYRRGYAGDTFNTAWHLARALGRRGQIGFGSRVGRDQISDAFVQELAQDGLDVSLIARDDALTMGLYLIELDGVERSFHYWRNASAARRLADDEAWLKRVMTGQALIHISGITIAILSPKARTRLAQALADARLHGARVSFDPNIRPRLWSSAQEIRTTIPQFLALSDIALPSFDDEQANFGDATPSDTLARYAAYGVAEVVVKNGATPVLIQSDGQQTQIATAPVSGIRDTTGAGDAFNAGYLAARLIGRDPVTAVSHGQEMSAQVLQHSGARIPKDQVPLIVAG
ncbi:sugar kinase [Thioclava indica]|uniref:Carbohydrate kinase PfkB domain-containing protein n=1 Tax=Thioclava indica TaxID=1353528 RepID=A0A074JPT1_9RHOB|nr:sugar kinase [Thioclava indica]KEO57940.1 hypothetical protein DT23_16940 [Thioclava indica]